MSQIVKNAFLISLLLQANFIQADIYRYQDENGRITFSDQTAPTATRISLPEKNYRYKHHVKRVYDGDTIILDNGERVRLLGLNTPEIESRYRQGEKGGVTAKKWLQDKLSQDIVFIEYDQQKKDKYNRSLAHLFLENGEHLNKSLLQAGLANLTIIPPNLHYVDELVKAEMEAQQRQVGIWSMKSYQPMPISDLNAAHKTTGWHRFLATPSKLVKNRSYLRLILSDKVDIRIPKKNSDLFPDLESYIGKSIEIRGWASRSKSHYSILIRHPSALIIL